MEKSYQLYRHRSEDGGLLYIGITERLPRRLKEHRKFSAWWKEIAFIEIEKFGSRDELLEAEKIAIQQERPKYNICYNRDVRQDENHSPLSISKDGVSRRVVTLKPLYKIKDAAQLMNISTMVLRRAIEGGEINCVELKSRTAVHQYISGWQIIDWLEAKGAKP